MAMRVLMMPKDLETFFIFGKSETLKQFLISTGEFKKMSKAQQAELNRGFLITRGYDKGVPHSSEETYQADGTSWASEPGIIDETAMRVRLSIEWTTLRYKQDVEFLNPNGTLKSVPLSRYGRCKKCLGDASSQRPYRDRGTLFSVPFGFKELDTPFIAEGSPFFESARAVSVPLMMPGALRPTCSVRLMVLR